jgi:hypothetical protein
MDSGSGSTMFLWLVYRVHCWGEGGHSVNQLAAIPALTTYTPSISHPPTLGDKANRERWPWHYASASHQPSAGKLRVIASALDWSAHFGTFCYLGAISPLAERLAPRIFPMLLALGGGGGGIREDHGMGGGGLMLVGKGL